MGCLFYLIPAVLIWTVRLTVWTVMAVTWLLIAFVVLILACCGRRPRYPRFRWDIF